MALFCSPLKEHNIVHAPEIVRRYADKVFAGLTGGRVFDTFYKYLNSQHVIETRCICFQVSASKPHAVLFNMHSIIFCLLGYII